MKFVLNQMEAPEGLEGKILAKINRKIRKNAMIKMAFFGMAGLLSSILLFLSGQYVFQELAQSGFYQYVSLIFSDGGLILAFWKEFSVLVLETLPTMAVALFLSTVLAFMWSFKNIIRVNIKLYGY